MDSAKKAFNRAAHSYDKYAVIQKNVAQKLFEFTQRYYTQHFGMPTNVCEIGTGTGYLAGIFLEKYPKTAYLVTDISPNMIEVSKKKLENYDNVSFMESAAETIDLSKKYDLIMSSLCLQWVEHLDKTLAGLFTKTNNMIAFTTLVDGTFEKLKGAYSTINQNSGVLNFLTLKELKRACSKLKNCEINIIEDVENESFLNIFDYAKRLQGIGAHSSDSKKYAPVDLNLLDKVMGNNFTLNYQVAYCFLTHK